MNDFFKYLTSGREDEERGIKCNVVGKARTAANAEYPDPKHPTGYYFNWENGRILSEYQILYITEGKGILETTDSLYHIEGGTVFFNKPGVWHRYKPLQKTGWTELYIGLEGAIVDTLFANNQLHFDDPVICCGHQEGILDYYYRIFQLASDEKPGFQFIISGLAIALLGEIMSHLKKKGFNDSATEAAIERSKFFIRENLESKIDFKELAASLNLSYSYFRTMFKQHAGISPGQYHLQLRLIRAKELLLTTKMPVKQIAFETGFDSAYYFSRMFKEKIKATPTEIRENLKSEYSQK